MSSTRKFNTQSEKKNYLNRAENTENMECIENVEDTDMEDVEPWNLVDLWQFKSVAMLNFQILKNLIKSLLAIQI
ncbi:7747_t:CDS:2 [Dentiscutata erythropus]|uniref:7747_t:CDS:1 n=1 Tax=Dentiscutata erythropus TaxID=1348616 RepID=A0A9N9JLJ8_9GLOM|nr:7747_t:CDS:2 [Dentiscutata erythropus]